MISKPYKTSYVDLVYILEASGGHLQAILVQGAMQPLIVSSNTQPWFCQVQVVLDL